MRERYVKTPTVYQMEATECGAASLAMIFGYFGRYMSSEKMRIETGVSRDGCNAGNLMRCAKKYGLECHGYRKETGSLIKTEPPCIIHWNFNHFVVFEGIKRGYAYINDPAQGRRRLSVDELDEAFTGIVLTFKPTDKFERQPENNTVFGFMKDRLSGRGGTVLKLLLIGLLLVIPGLAIPAATRFILDNMNTNADMWRLNTAIVFMVTFVMIKVFLNFYRGRVLICLQNKMILQSAYEFVSHLLRLPISFFEQRYAGDLADRVENNNNVNNFLSGELAESVLNLIISVFYLTLMILYSPILTLIVLCSAAVSALTLKLGSQYLSDISMKTRQDNGKLTGALCSGLNIISTLKASGAENEYATRILGYFARNISAEQKTNRFQQVITVIPQVMSAVTSIIILAVGGVSVMNGNMTIGMLAAFSALADGFEKPVESLVGFVRRIHIIKADIARVEDVYKYKEDEKFGGSADTKAKMSKLSGETEVKNISFGYSVLDEPLIKDFSFKLKSGESIALIGMSGCGKSTVSKILSGLYRPWSGEVLFDGKSIDKIPKEVLAASVSCVSQEPRIFSGTIRENLTMWNSGILESDIIKAAKDACIHDIITQKDGAYDYKLSEGGMNLSGGQRQRLEIARALVTNPSVLILDEATSALDAIVEKKILDNIKKRGCTCLVVAHRLTAIRDCDSIIVMDKGRAVQKGSHRELAAQGGLYADIIKNV